LLDPRVGLALWKMGLVKDHEVAVNPRKERLGTKSCKRGGKGRCRGVKMSKIMQKKGGPELQSNSMGEDLKIKGK